jgi:hypothetical protein
MNIKGHEIPQSVVESYLRACRYNQSVGTPESDQSQRDAHLELVACAGLDANDPEYDDLCFVIMELTDDHVEARILEETINMNKNDVKATRWHKKELVRLLSEYIDTSDIGHAIDDMIDDANRMRLDAVANMHNELYNTGFDAGYKEAVENMASRSD